MKLNYCFITTNFLLVVTTLQDRHKLRQKVPHINYVKIPYLGSTVVIGFIIVEVVLQICIVSCVRAIPKMFIELN